MKVFWSWQSDTPGNVGRHFVRDALDTAIARLKESSELAEAERDALHLDHDRKGLSGSPDLAPAILDKIRSSSVFVADVTTIGITSITDSVGKKVINSNVAIELGFAAGAIGDGKILMIQNTYYGGRDDLPFDLRGKAGPLQYRLAPDAEKDERRQVATDLAAQLREALLPFLGSADSAKAAPEVAWRLSLGASDFEGAGHLALLDRGGSDQRIVRFDHEQAVYLRLIPTVPLPRLTSARMLEVVRSQKLALIDPDWAPAQFSRSPTGATYFRIPPAERKRATAASQLLPTGEMWALSSLFFDRKSEIFDITRLLEPMLRTLRSFHEVYVRDLEGGHNVDIEIGAFNLRGWRCKWAPDRVDGPYYDFSVRSIGTLNWISGDAERARLIEMFLAAAVEEVGITASAT